MNFSDLNLHPAIAAALATRGYDTATPVQSAVLEPGNAGRDLLVSSQTGSGKTIAFGAALANTLFDPDAPPREQRIAPVALVIVPTRELAVQVREELTWLLRDTGLRLASFTGGTAVSGDLRVLQRGIDLVIGTPGRLVDLLRRERLQLTHVRVVVLDEADEMLDLGFREDLEKLLQAAPAARRTLLLSATLPAEIQSLARRFQRDAVRIDPRKDGGGGATARHAHGDITYVAHLITAADRLAVVVNVLRAAGNGRAIVFCTTREAVSRLHAALVARGFAATAISGDRAQAERDRALDQVRRGDARVLVATNVAARGLHLPDVDLIVHADLPLNAESLTHRSGRTGRAGRKGTAVVLASLSERRKAERLMSSANVPVVWTAPPSAEAITAAAREQLAEELLEESSSGGDGASGAGAGDDAAAEELVQRLESTLPARELARRLLSREFRRLPIGERIHQVAVPGPGSARRGDFDDVGYGGGGDDGERGGRKPGRGDFSRDGVMFRVNIGAKDNADPRWILPLICRRGGVTRREVGSIRIGPQETRFEIAGEAAADFALTASERDPRAPHVTIERVGDGGGPAHGARPAAAPRRPDNRPAHRADERRDTRPPAGPPPAPRPAAPRTPNTTSARPAAAAVSAIAATTSPGSTPPTPTTPAPTPTKVAAAPAPAAAAAPTPTPAPTKVAAEPAAAAAAAAAAPPPSHPIAATRTERPARHTAQGPVIEVKRAPQVGKPTPANKSHAAKAVLPATGGDPNAAGAARRPATPPVALPLSNRPLGPTPDRHPHQAGPRNRPTVGSRVGGTADRRPSPEKYPRARPGSGDRDHRPPRGGPPSEGGAHPHGRRTDGTNPVKRSPGAAAAPRPTVATAPTRVGASAPAPFWKEGARRRPAAGAPPRRDATLGGYDAPKRPGRPR